MNDIIPIENKVSQSQLVTIDLQEFMGDNPSSTIDLSKYLENGFLLREKSFRAALREEDLNVFKDHNVNVICSSDAIIPSWVYMLLVTKLNGIVNLVVSGSKSDLEKQVIVEAVERIPQELYEGKKVVIKGCGTDSHREFAYTEITKKMVPVVASLMYGEPCSTVPVYKKTEE